MSITNSVRNFLPSTSCLNFSNHYPKSTPYPLITLPIINLTIGGSDAGQGICGGFAYTVMDIFLHSPRVPPPAYTDRPATNTSRFDYLVRRLLMSFGLPPGYENAAKAID